MKPRTPVEQEDPIGDLLREREILVTAESIWCQLLARSATYGGHVTVEERFRYIEASLARVNDWLGAVRTFLTPPGFPTEDDDDDDSKDEEVAAIAKSFGIDLGAGDDSTGGQKRT